MGIYDREYYREDDGYDGKSGRLLRTWVARIIALNVSIFVANYLFFPPSSHAPDWLTHLLTLDTQTLTHPLSWWRFLSYSLAHHDFSHLLFNMLALWIFGRPIENLRGSREFLAIYTVAALCGGLLWAVRHQFWGSGNAAVIGASGAVTALVILFVCYYPRQTVLVLGIIPAPAWLMGLVIVGLDLLNVFNPRSEIAADVHLAGAALALLYHRQQWQLSRWFAALLPGVSPARSAPRRTSSRWSLRQLFRRRPQLRLHQDDQPDEFQAAAARREADLDAEADRILAKLHAHGDAALSDADRAKLDDYSRRLRSRRRGR